MEFGKTLRAAREARGKSIEEVARETRLMSQLIVDLENENMSRIAAPIYGRGFVKLYCEAVGLEARPMIDEFMKVYNGEHEPIIREKENVEENTSYSESSLLPEAEAEEISSPSPTSLFDAPMTTAEENASPTLSRYSSPLSSRESLSSFPTFSIPPIVWRVGALVTVAILILWLLVKAIGAIYHFSATDPKANESSEVRSEASAMSSHPLEEREPVAIPPLYID